MRRSEYMTKEEIKQENMKELVEWGEACKAGAIIVSVFFASVFVVDLLFVATCCLFGVW